ncbi:hypothetical protein L6164_009899 [Bauhinia variegata]|uniref:Uncharacterized protein n=1 Tax=Bauhinia variegata TaxID=167791 RepID=A0ACB9PP43_BAUVA|nr:hypothetical protein L6164_009899 [Bauhinia variegata]
MASSNDDPQSNNAKDDSCDGSFSYFPKTVCLYDWWLIKAENDFQGKQLAVAGLTSREREELRVFISAPIIKRHNVFSLETADGIHLIIRGFINEKRTKENGFPSEISNNFMFGFPPNWSSYAVNFLEGEFTTKDNSGRFLTPNSAPIGMGKSSLTFKLFISQEQPSGNHENENPFPEARSQNIQTGPQKTPTSGGPLKHPDEEQKNPTETTENPNGDKLKSPLKSVESLGEISMSSKKLAEVSAYRNLRALPITTKGKYETKRMVVLALPVDSKRKKIKSVSAGSNNLGESLSNQFDDLEEMKHEDGKRNIDGVNDGFQLHHDVKRGKNCNKMSLERGLRTRSMRKSKQHPTVQTRSKTKEGQTKISTDSPQISSFKRSRSGRLLLPSMQFWCNQKPLHDADHKIAETLEGSPLVSPIRGNGTQPREKRR